MLKRILSIMMAVMLVVSVAAVSAGAYNSYGDYSNMSPANVYKPTDSYTVDANTPYGEDAVLACGGSLEDTQKIYFQAPADWANEFNTFPGPDLPDDEPYMHACGYWWSGTGSDWSDANGGTVMWCGYQAHLADKENRIYYIVMPNDGGSRWIVFNNGVNSGMDKSATIFKFGRQLQDINTEGAREGDFDTLPEGSPTQDDFDGCIAIINYDDVYENPLSGLTSYGSNWYVYYGQGCYGYYPETSANYCGRTDSCVNPEHFDEDGNHIGIVNSGEDTPHEDTPHHEDEPINSENIIKFDNSVTNWAGPIQFYIYDPDSGDAPIAWGSKKLNGTNVGNGIWTKDISDYGLIPGKQYCIIFNDSASYDQTYDLVMDYSCIGDTAMATGDTIENPADFHKTARIAKWKSSSLGPRMLVTSIGNVVGETIPSFTNKTKMFSDFLTNTLSNARTFSGKDDQMLLDDLARALGLGKSDVISAINNTGVSVKWNKDKSPLPNGFSDSETSGTTGDCTWQIDKNTITVSGNGKMGDYTLSSPIGVTDVIIEEGVTTIGKLAFYESDTLERLSIGNSVTGIGQAAFLNCTKLACVSIPDSVSIIADEAFSGCTSLTDLTISNSVTDIGSRAFLGCASLNSVTVPESVTNIDAKAFGYYRNDELGIDRKINGFTIYGYEGSQAQKYAINNGFAFVKLTSKSNDLTGVSLDLPQDISVIVSPIFGHDATIASLGLPAGKNAKAVYDITAIKNGFYVQPGNIVSVKIPCTNEYAKVYRKEDDGSFTDMKAVYSNGHLVFNTSHLSVYLVVAPETGILGDVDEDGEVDIVDATWIQRHNALMDMPFELTKISSDIDGDGYVTIMDATFIQHYFCGMETLYNIGELVN